MHEITMWTNLLDFLDEISRSKLSLVSKYGPNNEDFLPVTLNKIFDLENTRNSIDMVNVDIQLKWSYFYCFRQNDTYHLPYLAKKLVNSEHDWKCNTVFQESMQG